MLIFHILYLGVYLYSQVPNIAPQASKSKIEVSEDIVEEFMKSSKLQEIVDRESQGNPTVISSADCMGKYQIHPLYFYQLGIDPYKFVVPDWNTPNHKGRFTMPVEQQVKVCRHFVKEQIAYFKRNGIPVTIYNLYKSWEGISSYLFQY